MTYEKSSEPGKFSSSSLVRYLRNEINSGRYCPGEKLESVRLLSARFGVGRQVALYALGQLVKQGLVVSSARRGYFISPDFRPNRFYRIGLLINDINPLRSFLNEALYFAALYYGYQLVPYHNFEAGCPMEDLLAQVNDLDGVIITGRQITDEMLRPFANGKLPYVVLGRYDISSRHPAEWFGMWNHGIKRLSAFIKKQQIRSAALIVGPRSSLSDRSGAIGYLDFLAKHNPDCQVETVFARDSGYLECRTLLSAAEPPQMLIFAGEHIIGYRKYVAEFPDGPRPAVAIAKNWEIAVPPELFDLVVPGPQPEEYRALMEKLLKRLNCF